MANQTMYNYRKKQRSTKSQHKRLAELAKEFPYIATNRCPGPSGPQRIQRTWSRITQELNKIGPPKSEEKWRDALKQMKYKALRKRSAMHVALEAANEYMPAGLTAEEEIVLSALNEAAALGFGDDETDYKPNPAQVPMPSPQVEMWTYTPSPPPPMSPESSECNREACNLNSESNVNSSKNSSPHRKSLGRAEPDHSSREAMAWECLADSHKAIAETVKIMAESHRTLAAAADRMATAAESTAASFKALVATGLRLAEEFQRRGGVTNENGECFL